MKVIIDGITKDLHYTIAAKLIKSGVAIKLDSEVKKENNPKPIKKVIRHKGRKK